MFYVVFKGKAKVLRNNCISFPKKKYYCKNLFSFLQFYHLIYTDTLVTLTLKNSIS